MLRAKRVALIIPDEAELESKQAKVWTVRKSRSCIQERLFFFVLIRKREASQRSV